jgi:hypothetical protein
MGKHQFVDDCSVIFSARSSSPPKPNTRFIPAGELALSRRLRSLGLEATGTSVFASFVFPDAWSLCYAAIVTSHRYLGGSAKRQSVGFWRRDANQSWFTKPRLYLFSCFVFSPITSASSSSSSITPASVVFVYPFSLAFACVVTGVVFDAPLAWIS